MANKKNIAVGAGLAAAAAVAAAGAYWFYGSEDASKHRRQVKSWMLKARADVMDAVGNIETIDKRAYLDIVERVLSRYAAMAGITSAELAQVARDLKSAWAHMEAAREARSIAKRATRSSKKIAAKAKKKASR